MFGAHAPRPFRWFSARNEVLGYSRSPKAELEAHARAFASPQAWAALVADSLASKPMPDAWRVGQRLQLEVLTCPVSRKDGHEKDVFLRALDRHGEQTPSRGEVYVDWFRRQWADAVRLEHVELTGFSRRRLLRRGQRSSGGEMRRSAAIERPTALFTAIAQIRDAEEFGRLTARGLGRHRAFGLGMVLLRPAP
jgi:CRISPR system Cascade subunit CasE